MQCSPCISAGQRLDQRARKAGLETIRVTAGQLPSIVYLKRSTAADHANRPLTIFLESHGIPWLGCTLSDDPTTLQPVALEMLMRPPPMSHIAQTVS